jgi:hypothetical protein
VLTELLEQLVLQALTVQPAPLVPLVYLERQVPLVPMERQERWAYLVPPEPLVLLG